MHLQDTQFFKDLHELPKNSAAVLLWETLKHVDEKDLEVYADRLDFFLEFALEWDGSSIHWNCEIDDPPTDVDELWDLVLKLYKKWQAEPTHYRELWDKVIKRFG